MHKSFWWRLDGGSKERILQFMQYLLALSILFSNGTMIGVLSGKGSLGLSDFKLRVIALFISIIYILFLIYNNIDKLTIRQYKIFLFLIPYFVIYLIVTRHSILSSMEAFVIPFFLFLIMSDLEGEELFSGIFNKYSNIIVVFAAISLFFYIFGCVLGWIPGITMEYSNNNSIYKCTNYYYLSFINSVQFQDVAGIRLMRNVGIFMEGPGFAQPLIISLYWKFFCEKRENKISKLILVLTIITTFSAKGYVFLVIILLAKLIRNLKDNELLWTRIKRFVLPVVIAGGAIIIFAVVFLRVKTTINGGSASIRIADMIAAAKTWIHHPVFGAGFYNLHEIYKFYTPTRTYGDPTCGILNILAYGGIYIFLLYILGFSAYFCRINNDSKLIIRGFILIFLLMTCISANQYEYIMLFFIAFGWSVYGRHNMNAENMK